MAESIGEISFYSNRAHWKIPYFFDIPQEINTEIQSPPFAFGYERHWRIIIHPNGNQYEFPDSVGWFGMNVRKTRDDSYGKCDVRLGIVGEFEKDIVNCRATGGINFRRTKLIRRSAIESDKDRIVPGGHLHLFMSIEEIFDYTVSPVMYVKSKDGTEKCTEKLKSATTEASTQTVENIEINELLKDFKEMLIRGNISDVILKVEEREFKVHRCVLAARSPVLLDMMMHDKDAKEQNTSVVELPHFDPNIFNDFLNYLYTGNMENINSENVMKLFEIADLYKVNALRKVCVHHIMKDISVDNFCDVFSLSLQHDEECLKEACTLFFAENSLAIVLAPKWKEFLCSNPEAGNDLFVKQLQMNEISVKL